MKGHHSQTKSPSTKISLVRVRSSEKRSKNAKPPSKMMRNLKNSNKIISKKLITFSSESILNEIRLHKSNPELNIEIKNTDEFSWPKFTEVKLCDQNFESVVSEKIEHEVMPGDIIRCNLRFDDLTKVSSTMLLHLKWRNAGSGLCYQSQWAKLTIKKV